MPHDAPLDDQPLQGGHRAPAGPSIDPARSGPGDLGTPASPRAFVSASGLVFQLIGGTLLAGSCAMGAWLTYRIPPAAEASGPWLQHVHGAAAAGAIATAIVLTNLIAAIGIIAAGAGMQGEHPTSARIAGAMTGIAAFITMCLAIALRSKGGSIVGMSAALGLTLLHAGLFLMALRSASLLRRFPPPADRNDAPKDWADHYFRRKHS